MNEWVMSAGVNGYAALVRMVNGYYTSVSGLFSGVKCEWAQSARVLSGVVNACRVDEYNTGMNVRWSVNGQVYWAQNCSIK